MTIGLEQVVVLLQSSQNIASTTDVCLVLWDAFDEIDAASPRPASDSGVILFTLFIDFIGLVAGCLRAGTGS
jgi:hypothetical protein